jgi:mutator protein MutT
MKQTSWITLYNEKGQILILRRAKKANNPGQWNYPGGTVDNTCKIPAICAYKELQEETGIVHVNLNLLFTLHHPDFEMFYYTGVTASQPAIKLQKSENDRALWVNVRDLYPQSSFNLHKSIFNYFNYVEGSFISSQSVANNKTLVCFSYLKSTAPSFDFYLTNPALVVSAPSVIDPFMITKFVEMLKKQGIKDVLYRKKISPAIKEMVTNMLNKNI